MAEETDYEQERLRNIRENEKLMRELGVMGGSSAIGGPPRPKKAAATTRRAKPATPKKDLTPKRIMPTRSSARLAGHEADSEVLKRKYEEEAEEARKVAEAAKRARHGQFDLSGMTGGELEIEHIQKLEATLQALATNNADVVHVEDEKKHHSQDRKELEQLLNRMTLRSVAKVTPKRVYSMAYHSSTEKNMVFVGDKEGMIGLWDASAPTVKEETGDDEDEDGDAVDSTMPEGQTWSLQVHGKSPVTCLKLDPVSSNSLYSSSYDATIRKLDLGTSKSDEVWAGEDDVLLSIFDILSPATHAAAFTDTPSPSLDERSIWIADHRGGLLHVDLRESRRRTARRWQVCEKKIGAMSLNRAQPHCIATASLDQHVRLFDVRALSTLKQTDSAPYNYKAVDPDDLESVQAKAQFAAHQARLACTSVDFSPRGDQLVGVSYDDMVKVWNLQPSWLHSRYAPSTPSASPRKSRGNGLSRWFKVKKEEEETVIEAEAPQDILAEPVKIPHNNQTGKWLTLFRARWHQNPNVEPHFTIGSMTRRAEIYSADGTLLRTLYDEDNVTAVPAVTATHPILPGRLATGNASGRCTWWSADP